MTGEEIIKTLSDKANGCSRSSELIDEMLNHFVKDHRTLQQGMIRMMVEFMIKWASLGKEQSYVDLRNKAAWDFCTKLKDDCPGFPLI